MSIPFLKIVFLFHFYNPPSYFFNSSNYFNYRKYSEYFGFSSFFPDSESFNEGEELGFSRPFQRMVRPSYSYSLLHFSNKIILQFSLKIKIVSF